MATPGTPRARRARLALAAAWLAGCGAASIPPLETPVAAPAVVAALDLASAAHPGALPYAVDIDAEGGKCRLAVWMLEGGEVHGVHLDVEQGGVRFDETAPIAEGALGMVPALVHELAARDRPLRRGAEWMLGAYGLSDLRTVELEMHGTALVLEAVLGDEDDPAIQVHDPDDGRCLMTEVGAPPGAGGPGAS